MELTLTSGKPSVDDLGQLNHLNRLKQSLLDILNNQPTFTEKKGISVYKSTPILRDIATVMEHPEFYSFYEKYLSKPDNQYQILTVLKVYYWISKYLPEQYNAYHKLFILYTLLHHPDYSRLIFNKKLSITP